MPGATVGGRPDMHDHDHSHDDASEESSTGFFPMGLALGLFVIGVFALGWVRCEPDVRESHDMGNFSHY